MLPNRLRESITGLVLAGGQARRMGGVDKGLVEVGGRPMIEHVIDALAPQVGRLFINANRNVARYAAYGHRVVPDSREGFLGPLAGILSALDVLETDYLLTTPCDSPLVTPDLAERMYAALCEQRADIVVARDGRRQQPTFLLLRRDLAADLADFLDSGGRKVDRWFARHRLGEADMSDRPECFLNVNDPEERERLEALVHSNAASP